MPGVGTATGQAGPTGVAPLRIDTPGSGQAWLVGGVPTDVGGTFTLSFYAKAAPPPDGDGDEQTSGRATSLQARLYPVDADPWWVAPYVQDVPVTGEWQRFSHTVDLPAAADGFHLFQLVATGPGPGVLIDGLMVEAGDAMSDFARAAPVELGLTSPMPLGVYEQDEPIRLTLSAWGELARLDRVTVRLTDGRGDVHEQTVRPERDGSLATAAVTADTDALPLGPIRVEARAFDADGNAVSPYEEVVLHRVRAPRQAGERLPDSPFGTHLWLDRQDDIDAAARLGFRWVRLFEGLDWPTIEPREGEFAWDATDRLFRQLDAHGFSVLAILGTTPQWAQPTDRGIETIKSGYWRKKAVPRSIDEYRDYVARVAERYAGRVQAYEPWNEPFWARFFTGRVENGQPVRGTPEQYVAIQRAAAEAIRSHDPDALLVWNTGSAYDREDAVANDRAIAAAGGLDPAVADLVSYHDYAGANAPAGFPGDLASTTHPAAVKRLLAEAGRPDLPVWESESGSTPATPSGNWYDHAVPAGRHAEALDTADRLVRLYVSRLAAGVDKWFLYTFSAQKDFRPTYDMLAPDGHLPPWGPALSNLFWHLEGKAFDRTVELPGPVYAYLFRSNDEQVAVLLPQNGVNWTLADPPDAVAVRDWYGNDLQPGKTDPHRPTYLTFPPDANAAALLPTLIKAP